MSRGILVQCETCGTEKDVTEAVSHDIFGFTLAQVQHILHDYREQVPHGEALQIRVLNETKTRLQAIDLLVRMVRAGKYQDVVSVFAEIRTFLDSIGALK